MSMDTTDREYLEKLFLQLAENLGEIKDILRKELPRAEWERVKAYGFGHAESGMLENGDAMPCPYTIQKAVESLLGRGIET